MCAVTQSLGRTGSRLFQRGFRPFFLAAAVHSLLVIALWSVVMQGWIDWQAELDPLSWHAHEMLFGAVGAAIAGFLLTAVPNWTGRLPIQGRRLALLFMLWLAPRLLWPLPGSVAPLAAAGIEVLFWTVLLLSIAQEITLSGKYRNLIVVAALLLVVAAEMAFVAGFLLEAADTLRRANLAMLALAVLLVSLIGGRIVPSFTRNWLAGRGPGPLPKARKALDAASLGGSALGLSLWLGGVGDAAGPVLLAAAAAQMGRLALWRGWRTLAEPLLAILHLAYLWIPFGLALLGAAQLWPQSISESAALHALGAGALGTMVMAVTTRATLGHSGRELHADRATVAIFAAVLLSAGLRVVAGLWPEGLAWLDLSGTALLAIAALLWVIAQAGFLLRYLPILLGQGAQKP
jgi:uncharacterized protein involved in response to NO